MLLTIERYCFAQKFCLQNQDTQLKLSERIYSKQQRGKRGKTTEEAFAQTVSVYSLSQKQNFGPVS